MSGPGYGLSGMTPDELAELRREATEAAERNMAQQERRDAALGGVLLIKAERLRQVDAEGWTPEHDDEHQDHELARAAVCYVEASYGGTEVESPWDWPWAQEWWKPSDDAIRMLVKAGALIAAEIDRLGRLRSVGGQKPAPPHSAQEDS